MKPIRMEHSFSRNIRSYGNAPRSGQESSVPLIVGVHQKRAIFLAILPHLLAIGHSIHFCWTDNAAATSAHWPSFIFFFYLICSRYWRPWGEPLATLNGSFLSLWMENVWWIELARAATCTTCHSAGVHFQHVHNDHTLCSLTDCQVTAVCVCVFSTWPCCPLVPFGYTLLMSAIHPSICICSHQKHPSFEKGRRLGVRSKMLQSWPSHSRQTLPDWLTFDNTIENVHIVRMQRQ